MPGGWEDAEGNLACYPIVNKGVIEIGRRTKAQRSNEELAQNSIKIQAVELFREKATVLQPLRVVMD